MRRKLIIAAAIFIIVLWVVYYLYRMAGLDSRYVIRQEGVHYKGWSGTSGYYDILLPHADPQSFKTLNKGFYGKDDTRVFYQGKEIPDADANSFEPLNEFYAKDKLQAYYLGKPIPSSLGPSFQLIDNSYSKDNQDVYYNGIPLATRSVQNFTFLPESKLDAKSGDRLYPWATDGYFFYYKNYRIPSDHYADVQVFPYSAGIAKDKLWVYYLDHRINYNEKGEKRFDVDVSSFVSIDPYNDGGKDKYGCIEASVGRIKCD